MVRQLSGSKLVGIAALSMIIASLFHSFIWANRNVTIFSSPVGRKWTYVSLYLAAITSTLLILLLGRYFCRWTISSCEYQGTCILYIYVHVFIIEIDSTPNNVIIIKTKILLPQAYIIMVDFRRPV
jgi:hypothetical protein